MYNIDLSEGRVNRYTTNTRSSAQPAWRRHKVQTIVYSGVVTAAFLFVAGVIVGVFP